MANVTGTNMDDTLIRGAGNDIINAGSGNDLVEGGAGNDKISGGSGGDTLDGGSGSDIVNGDSGNDLLIYNLNENISGSKDVYTGGSGIDTIRLELTQDQWADPSVRAELQRYVDFLSTVKTNPQCEVSNGSASDFVFNFGSGTTLTVQMMEKLEICVQDSPGGKYEPFDHLSALITGTSTAELTESNATLTASGQLFADDFDNPDNAFQAQTNVAGSNGYGIFSIDANGAWTYTMNDAHDEFKEGLDYNDSFTVKTADGTEQVVTVTIHGSNDAAVITGTATDSVLEAGGVANDTPGDASASGDLDATDVDSSNAFVVQSAVAKTYGTFSIDAAGVWSYTLDNSNTAVQALNPGSTPLHELVTVATADGTEQVIDITINGANDAAVITGTATDSVLEAGGVANGTPGDASASGDLDATDVDSSNAFVVQSAVAKTYGTFSIDAAGVWSYTLDNSNTAVQALNLGSTPLHELVTVATADGTEQVIDITINGANDAALVSSATVALAETNTPVSTTGTLTSDDVDNPDNAFTAGSTVGAIGTFSIDAAGAWAFTANSAFNQLNVGDSVTETYNVTSVDGTPSTVQITINGTNDVPTIAGASIGSVQEDADVLSGQLTTNGQLTIADADYGQSSFRPQASVAGTYGTFTLTAAGAWTYSVNNSLTAIQALNAGQSLLDSFQAVSQDDSATQTVTVTIQGTDDAIPVNGTTGNDTFSFSATGSGTYTISDPGGNNDAIQITGDNSKLSALNFEKAGNDLLIEIGDQDITVLNQYAAGGANTVETITFGSGQTFHGFTLTGSYTLVTTQAPGNANANWVLAGTSGGDALQGGNNTNQHDLIFGNALNDILTGRSGDDLLVGGAGNDSLTGGSGADRFVFAEAGTLNLDSVLDYSFSQGDTLNLSTLLDANFTNTSQVSDFVKLTQTGTNGTNVTVQVDTDGSAGGANFVDVASLTNYGTSGNDLVRVLFEGTEHQLNV